MWKLVIEDDEGKRTVVPITRDDYTIGRKEGNSIRLTERNVSRDHAKLHKKNGVANEKPIFTLEDLTSYNGVYVNGLRVAERQELAHGDLIQIGDYRIVLQDDAAEAGVAEEEAPPVETEDLKSTMPEAVPVPAPLRATNATFLEKPNRLVVLAGPNPGEEFPLVGDRLTVGRAEDATISINHNSVSRLHCEIHSLGEGRFEIVDKGSSNGVRVNGADLRRGIIEAGDVIELGDVKFKFVGEGQLFRPGTNDSQQIAAISQRAATIVTEARPQKSNLLTAVLLGTILALGGIAVYVVKARHVEEPVPEPPPSATSADTTGADAAMLADARRMADIGDVDGAHQKAMQLAQNSPLHSSDDFKYVDYKWATMTLFKADSEADPSVRYQMLQRVVADPYVDPMVRKTAQDRMAAIATAPAAGASVSGRLPAAASAPIASHVGAVHTLPSPDTTPTPPPPTRPTRAVAPPTVDVHDLVGSANPSDWDKARGILELKVFGKHPSAEDVRLLKSVCKQQHDTTCLQSLPQL